LSPEEAGRTFGERARDPLAARRAEVKQFLLSRGLLIDEPLPAHRPSWGHSQPVKENLNAAHNRLLEKTRLLMDTLKASVAIHVFPTADLPLLTGEVDHGFKGHALLVDPKVLAQKGVGIRKSQTDGFVRALLDMDQYLLVYGAVNRAKVASVPIVLFLNA